MKQVVSFSGGRTSAYLVHLMEEKRKNEGWDVSYIFMDTGAEHPKTYEFIKNAVKYWDMDLICLRVVINPKLGKGNSYKVVDIADIGKDLKPWEDMLEKYGTPYLGGAFCTDRMKTKPYIQYCSKKFGKGEYTTWLGMRADEPNRLKKEDGIKYLAELSDFDKNDILTWWEKQPFNLEIDEHLGNCVFCIKKSVGKIGLATKDEKWMALKFASILSSKKVRILESRTSPSLVMYRGKNTLMQIINTYKDMDRDQLFNTLRFSKRDSGGCSESCEIFNDEQLDLFANE